MRFEGYDWFLYNDKKYLNISSGCGFLNIGNIRSAVECWQTDSVIFFINGATLDLAVFS